MDASQVVDSSAMDARSRMDSSGLDASLRDVAANDGELRDVMSSDGGASDGSGLQDAEPSDSGLSDSGRPDTGADDAGTPTDAGAADASSPDAGDPCGNGIREADEACDTAIDACCNATCTGPVTAGATCRPAFDVCDVAEACDGRSPECPPDEFSPPSVTCRPSAGSCDVMEQCSGISAACPPDGFHDSGRDCRPSVGSCDLREMCSGVSADCPEDAFAPVTTMCREALGACDVAENCTGSSPDCPVDMFEPTTRVCRPSTGGCDLAESCTGSSSMCPPDDAGECPGAIAVPGAGGRLTVPLTPHQHTGSCGGSGSEGYLSFTLTETSDVFITTHSTVGLDSVLYVRRCGCGGAELACNDDADGLTSSSLQLTAMEPGTYVVVVDTKAIISSAVTVDVYISTPGANSDRCGNPGFIPAGLPTLTGSTCTFGADNAPVASSGCGFAGSGAGPDRVFYFVLPAAATVSMSGCTAASDYDQTFYIRSVCSDATAAAQLSCNDDGCGGPDTCTRNLRSSLTTPVVSPGVYYLFVDGFEGGAGACPCGNFEIDIAGL